MGVKYTIKITIMKKRTEIIIALTSTFIFFYLASYVSVFLFGEMATGAATRDLINTGFVLFVLAGISIFSFIFSLDYLKSYYLPRRKLASIKA